MVHNAMPFSKVQYLLTLWNLRGGRWAKMACFQSGRFHPSLVVGVARCFSKQVTAYHTCCEAMQSQNLCSELWLFNWYTNWNWAWVTFRRYTEQSPGGDRTARLGVLHQLLISKEALRVALLCLCFDVKGEAQQGGLSTMGGPRRRRGGRLPDEEEAGPFHCRKPSLLGLPRRNSRGCPN
jgi:hypothetical protein